LQGLVTVTRDTKDVKHTKLYIVGHRAVSIHEPFTYLTVAVI